MYPSPRGGNSDESVECVRARGSRAARLRRWATLSASLLQPPFCLLFGTRLLVPRNLKIIREHNNRESFVVALHTPLMAPTSTSDLEDLVEDHPELPAEIWAIIWRLLAGQSGFVGARRLLGDAICKAALEGWGLYFLFWPPVFI